MPNALVAFWAILGRPGGALTDAPVVSSAGASVGGRGLGVFGGSVGVLGRSWGFPGGLGRGKWAQMGPMDPNGPYSREG